MIAIDIFWVNYQLGYIDIHLPLYFKEHGGPVIYFGENPQLTNVSSMTRRTWTLALGSGERVGPP